MSASENQELWALPNAEYEHKIIDLQKKIIPLVFQPNEWMRVIFMEWLGIQTPHIWQIENSLHLCQGTDVFITVKTDSGKSALTLAPVIARHLRNEAHVAIVVYPTEALISDQVSINLKWCMHLLMGTYFIQEGKVQRRGVCFIAISLNILGCATTEGHNLWREVEDGMWDVIGMGPEMIQTAPRIGKEQEVK